MREGRKVGRKKEVGKGHRNILRMSKGEKVGVVCKHHDMSIK